MGATRPLSVSDSQVYVGKVVYPERRTQIPFEPIAVFDVGPEIALLGLVTADGKSPVGIDIPIEDHPDLIFAPPRSHRPAPFHRTYGEIISECIHFDLSQRRAWILFRGH